MKRAFACASIAMALATTNCLVELSRPLDVVDAKDGGARDANALLTVDAAGAEEAAAPAPVTDAAPAPVADAGTAP